MYTITFYSFKGGVGRTLALVNVGVQLARMGRRVLLVDFDLEAPGLATFDLLKPKEPHPGLVEYAKRYSDDPNEMPPLMEYLYKAKTLPQKDSTKTPGEVWVMPAGRGDSEYRKALAGLDWQDLYKNKDGFLFFEETKLEWEEFIKPDYVLIDARTGHTDVEGICTRQLPDAVVVLFFPNEQNLAGLKEVCKHIRAEKDPGRLDKDIKLHFVMSNVPNLDDEDKTLRQMRRRFAEDLNYTEPSAVIHHYPSMQLLAQRVFVQSRRHSKLARSYRRLVRTLLKDNLADRDGAMIFLKDYRKRIQTRQPGEEGVFPVEKTGASIPPTTSPPPASSPPVNHRICYKESYSGLLPPNNRSDHLFVDNGDGRFGCCIAYWRDKYSLHRIANSFDSDTEILNQVAECFILEEDWRSANEMFSRALRATPSAAYSLLRRAFCRTNLGLANDAAEDLLTCLRLSISDRLQTAPDYLGEIGRSACMGSVNILRKLRDIAPARLPDVADMMETQGLDDVDPIYVAAFLCDTEEGTPRAGRLLRGLLAGLNGTETIESSFVRTLLRARCWKDVIQLHEAGRIEQRGADSMLEAALAYWGEAGAMPESLCAQALERLEKDELFVSLWGLPTAALLFWRVGQVADALECLANAERNARAKIDDTEANDPFSVWRLCQVSIKQYLDDCGLLRRMFQGEPLRPAFLGPAVT